MDLPRSAIADTIEFALCASTAELFWPADPKAASIHVDYLSEPGHGPLRGQATVLRRRIEDAVVEVTITDTSDGDRRVAVAVATVIAAITPSSSGRA